jgi:plastocyanin
VAPAAIVLLALTGVVRLSGFDSVKPTVVTNTTDPEVCGARQSLDDLVVSEDGGLRFAIVALQNAPELASPPKELVLDNAGCHFEPHAAVATVGTTLVATNSDAVLHTTHYYGPAEANISLPVEGMRVGRKLTKPGLYVVKCDVHGWMQAFIRVDAHPYHAVTDASGRFRIEAVPPGRYTLEVWHERLGVLTREVVVDSTGDAEIEIEYAQEASP